MQTRAIVGMVCFMPGRSSNRRFPTKGSLFLLTSLLIHMGCASFNSYQSPDVLLPGKATIGIGLGGRNIVFFKEDSYFEATIYGRIGILKNCDMGVQLSPGEISGDMKLQVLNKPVLVSFDMGVSTGGYDNPLHFRYPKWLGLYPMIMLGTQHIYGGLKCTFVHDLDYQIINDMLLPGIMLGVTFGSKLQLKPEVNFYYNILNRPENKSPLILTMGLGIQAEIKNVLIKKPFETEKYNVKLDNQTDYKAELYIHGSTYHAVASPHTSVTVEDIYYSWTDYSLEVTDNLSSLIFSVTGMHTFRIGVNTCVIYQDKLGKPNYYWE